VRSAAVLLLLLGTGCLTTDRLEGAIRAQHTPNFPVTWDEEASGVQAPPPPAVAAPTVAPEPVRSTPARSGTPVVLAVFDIVDGSHSLDPGTLDQLTDYLATRVAEVLGYRVLPREQIRARLTEGKEASYKTCVDQSCQIELGKALAAQKSLATKILRVGSTCAMTGTLYDLRTETTAAAASAKTNCSSDALISGIDQLIASLPKPQ
jgi:hypothetical protein